MATRTKPVVVSTRMDRADRALLRALAEIEGVSVCSLVHRLIVPAVRQRLGEATSESRRSKVA